MALFRFFKTPKPQQYTYVPRFYDPIKEDVERRVRNASPSEGLDQGTEEVKARIQRGFRSRQPMDKMYRRKHQQKSNRLVLIIFVVLIILTWYLISNYMGPITDFLG